MLKLVSFLSSSSYQNIDLNVVSISLLKKIINPESLPTRGIIYYIKSYPSILTL